jgi:hypothetical protein
MQHLAYHPDAFDPKAVVFDNPQKRWQKAFKDNRLPEVFLNRPRHLPACVAAVPCTYTGRAVPSYMNVISFGPFM